MSGSVEGQSPGKVGAGRGVICGCARRACGVACVTGVARGTEMEVPTLAVSPEDHTRRVIFPHSRVVLDVLAADLGSARDGWIDRSVGAGA